MKYGCERIVTRRKKAYEYVPNIPTSEWKSGGGDSGRWGVWGYAYGSGMMRMRGTGEMIGIFLGGAIYEVVCVGTGIYFWMMVMRPMSIDKYE